MLCLWWWVINILLLNTFATKIINNNSTIHVLYPLNNNNLLIYLINEFKKFAQFRIGVVNRVHYIGDFWKYPSLRLKGARKQH